MTLVDQLSDRFAVEPILRVIGVAPSTYHGWRAQAAQPCARKIADSGVVEQQIDPEFVTGPAAISAP